jgi:hypothetical protein
VLQQKIFRCGLAGEEGNVFLTNEPVGIQSIAPLKEGGAQG